MTTGGNRPVFRVHTFHGARVTLDPPPPPDDLVEFVGYERAVKYGAYLAMRRSHLPRATVIRYVGIPGDPFSRVALNRITDVLRDVSAKLSKLAPVMPEHWEPWIEEMREELIAFDLLTRTTGQGRLPIIAFAGPDRSGKSTAARWFHERMGGEIMGFGERVKELAEEMHLAKNVGRGEKGCWERAVYVTLAQTMREHVDPAYWIRPVAERVREGRWNIIDDLRFENEADWVRRSGGIVVRMVRSGTDYHPSQRGAFRLDRYDLIDRQNRGRYSGLIILIVDNSGPLGATRTKFDRMMRYLYRAGEATLRAYRRSTPANP